MESWHQRDLQSHGGGLARLDPETVHRWRSEIRDRLADADTISDRRRRAKEEDTIAADNAKVENHFPAEN